MGANSLNANKLYGHVTSKRQYKIALPKYPKWKRFAQRLFRRKIKQTLKDEQE